MNFKTTIVLLVLLVVVGLVLLIARPGSKPEGEQPDQGGPKLVDMSSSDVSKLTVTSSDGQKLILEKTGTDWRMIQPVSAPAESWSVDSLVRGLTDLRSRGQVDASSPSTGLNPPRYTVELTGGGKTATIKIGTRSAIGDNLYVQREGDKQASVVAGDVYEQLDKPFTSFRQTRLVTASSSDIKQIQITRPDGKIVLEKSGENWQMTAPEKMPVDSSAASDLTFAITGLTAQEFVTPADIPSPLRPSENPRTTVWFSTQAPATQPTTQPAGTTVQFGGYDSVLKKNVYVAVSEPAAVAKVSATSLDSFNKKPLELRDKKVVDVDPNLASRVVIRTETPATTQPTTKPAETKEVVLERKKVATVLGPELPTTRPTTEPTTQPTTAPTTMASTQPSTQPVLPVSNWTLTSAGPTTDAGQAAVDGLLEKFHPLRADKYLSGPVPATQPSATYVIEILVDAGGGKTVQHQIRLTDPGEEKPLIGEYNGLVFETSRTLIQTLTGDFVNKPEAPKPPETPMPSGQ